MHVTVTLNMAKSKTKLQHCSKKYFIFVPTTYQVFCYNFFHQLSCFRIAEAHLNVIFSRMMMSWLHQQYLVTSRFRRQVLDVFSKAYHQHYMCQKLQKYSQVCWSYLGKSVEVLFPDTVYIVASMIKPMSDTQQGQATSSCTTLLNAKNLPV